MCRASVSYDSEHLNPAPTADDSGLSRDDVALGVNRQTMQVLELTDLVAWSTESRKEFPAGVIHYSNLFISAVGYIDEPLIWIGRKIHPRHGANSRKLGGLALNQNIPLEVSHLVEHLNSITVSVADVDKPVFTNDHTVNDHQEDATNTGVSLGLRSLLAPLAEEVPVMIRPRQCVRLPYPSAI